MGYRESPNLTDQQHVAKTRRSVGFDVGQSSSSSRRSSLGGQSPRHSGMPNQTLSSRRELVEQLDSESLYDYLLQNGVLESEAVEDMRQEVSPAKCNLALLKHVEDSGKSAEGLLLIGLRQTGQHYLANLLDDSARIKALSGSGYLSKSRHKGQLNIKVQVRAVKLQPESFRASTGEMLASREWVSLDDVLCRGLGNGHNGTPTPVPTPTPSIPQIEVVEAPDDNEDKQSSCCLCNCFGYSKKKKQKNAEKNNQINSAKTAANGSASKYIVEGGTEGQSSSTLNEIQIPRASVKRASSERIRKIDNVFHQKSADFYTLLTEEHSDVHTLLLKYFEQERGLLVLDTFYETDGVTLTNICNTSQQFEGLRQDCTSGKLLSDLEKWLVTEETLQLLGARGLKLHLEYSAEDLEQVQQELSQ